MKISSTFPTSSYSLLVIVFIFSVCHNGADGQNAKKVKIDVGLILDLESRVGKMSQSCISIALSDFYSAHANYTTRLVFHTRDSKKDIVEAASAAIDLLKNVQVQAIVGPQLSSQAKFVVSIANRTRVPIISFSATGDSLSTTQTPYFIRTALNDSTQVKAIADIVKAFSWREVVPIYEATDYGKDLIPYLTDAIQEANARIAYRSVISPSATDDQIVAELYKLMTMQTRVFVVHMMMSLASRLFSKAQQIGMMDKEYVWIITDGLTDLLGSMESSTLDSMQGVVGVKPYVPRSKKLNNFRSRWRRKFIQEYPDIDNIELNSLVLWAYDSIWALAMAAEKVETTSLPFMKSDKGKNSTDLDSLGVSQMGPAFLKAILKTKFYGLNGEFRLEDGQLQVSAFQIVNVLGKGERGIGFWSPDMGISQKLEVTDRTTYSTPMNNLGAIIWPGESTVVPKGWETPTNEKKLKIGVPVKNGFGIPEFVKVEKNPDTNATVVTGFCIDVFKTVMNSLPYAVPYEFIPFANNSDQSAGTYTTLVDQIYTQNYDGVVGDITILADRSQHVDFTLPYTEAGVSMIVPLKGDKRRNGWIFLKPLTKDLWITTGVFFIFTGFVIWVLEHRINKDFRGSPSQQVGMIFWFSFSTLVFAHRERVISNLSRFVLIIWVFVVLILTSSYTASLTSKLTVQQLQPTVTDIKDLIKNGDFVGYQSGSYVKGLIQRLGFNTSKLIYYNTLEEYDEALSKGSKNGGVSVIIDEIPYIKLFLAKYCTKYTMVGPTYKTAGFGFAFTKGSSLVPDISRAVLNVTEGDKMVAIERAWFGNQVNCPEQGGSKVTSDSLTLDSFWGLFLVAGVTSVAALTIFFFIFLLEHKDILNSENTLSRKVSLMAKQFDKVRDESSIASKKEDPSFNGTTAQVEETRPEQNVDQSSSPAISICHRADMIFSHEDLSSTEPGTPTGDPQP